MKGQAVHNSSRLALYHCWVAFAVFLPAVALGAWQMLMRSPLPAPLDDPNAYYASVTLHGTAMAYVITTFFAMGFGYAVAATSLGRPLRGVAAAWIGFVICLIGTLMAVFSVLSGRASVLYTFYPPLLASIWYYLGAFLLIGGSMIWVVLMVYDMAAWKRDNPGQPVPLAMFAITATALLWAWAASGVIIELLGVLLPRALGLTTQIDAGLGRTLFSVTRSPASNIASAHGLDVLGDRDPDGVGGDPRSCGLFAFVIITSIVRAPAFRRRPIAAVRRIRPEPGNQKHPQVLVAPQGSQPLILAARLTIGAHCSINLVQQRQQRLLCEGPTSRE
jgi:hypothetical protein